MKFNKNTKIAIVFTAGAVVWMLSGLLKSDENTTKKLEEKKVKVFAKTVKQEQYIPEIKIVGRTAIADEVDLVAEVSGKVDKVLFEQGDYVNVDDLMLTLENDYRKDNLKAAQESVKAAELKLDIAKDLAKQAYKAKTDLADRQSDYTSALYTLTTAKKDYENSFVKAPIAGFVEEKNVSLGDYVNADTVLYKIISQDKMYLVGYLSQNQVNRIKIGQKAYGIFNNGKRLDGIVSFISQKADESTKTYKVEVTVKLDKAGFKVREGLTVRIAIPSDKMTVYKVPHSAMVINDDGKVGIRYVSDNNIVKFLETELVNDTNDYQLLHTGTDYPLDLIIRGQVDVEQGAEVDVSYSDKKPQSNKNGDTK